MKTLELFCGTKSFSKVMTKHGYETFTVDNEPKFEPDLCIDIMQLTPQMILEKYGQPDIIWASPPCTCFSVASICHYWKDGKPKCQKTLDAIELVKRTLWLIDELKPKYWFVENPRGMLRKQSFMPTYLRKTITYCQYGMQWQKATDIWTNCEAWIPKPICSPKSPCHIRSPRGSRNGIQGLRTKERASIHPDSRYHISRSAIERAVIPPLLFEEILESIEKVKDE